MSALSDQSSVERLFHITVLGRTLEHLGVQMYKRRDIAIAELVANSWDAGATRVDIFVPNAGEYQPSTSEIMILDNGIGMSDDEVENQYLVVGRNRRLEDTKTSSKKRPVMGKKGIGKLAGFGIASEMSVLTWKDDRSTQLTLDVKILQTSDGAAKNMELRGVVGPRPIDVNERHGTRIVLRNLKHSSAPEIAPLRESLSRRFSRRVRGEMKIFVNSEIISEPNLELAGRFPPEGYTIEQLPSGNTVSYYYAFASSNIRSKELQGFTIYVRGKTAQAPPFFFGVETVASGLHYARYMTGEIEADFIDEDVSNVSDIISTDRQHIDWDEDASKELFKWGETLARKALREWANQKGEEVETTIMQIPAFAERIQVLDSASQKQVSGFLQKLGGPEADPEQTEVLADTLIRAFEYQHFHDVIEEIEEVSDDPEQLALLLDHLTTWKVLESRAILEIINGRLEVIEKFHSMIVNNAPETASSINLDNMHDLVAGFPWILNPEWQVLAEEKKISTQLKEWNAEDIQDADEKLRYDFLALSDDRRLVVIEIKRPDHTVELNELQRLETYKERLSKAHDREMYMVMICGGTINLTAQTQRVWEERPDGEIRKWKDIYKRTRDYYNHYRAVLDRDIQHEDFARKEREVAQTRNILQPGAAHRDPATRRKGLGSQDRNDQE